MALNSIQATVDHLWAKTPPNADNCCGCGEIMFSDAWRLGFIMWINDSHPSVNTTNIIVCDDCYQEFINP